MKLILKEYISGLLFVAIFASIALYLSNLEFIKEFALSSLTLAILLGLIYGNTFHKYSPKSFSMGINFAQKKLLRLGIILYGFRISFQQIYEIGLYGVLLDLFVVSSILIFGYIIGTKLLKLEPNLSALISSGSAICGAAAVLGIEPVVKAKPHETSIAVASVVVFGTIAMFLFPAILSCFNFSETQLGLALGSTIHEVAQVLAASISISDDVAKNALIVKLTRVMLLIPVLFIFTFIFNKNSSKSSIFKQFPWFAIFFLVACAINSTNIIPQNFSPYLNNLANILLTMAMAALGLETNFSKIKQLGPKPLILAALLFLLLISYMFIPYFV